jgi:hypothetical protein
MKTNRLDFTTVEPGLDEGENDASDPGQYEAVL